jgi:hypothetical protein
METTIRADTIAAANNSTISQIINPSDEWIYGNENLIDIVRYLQDNTTQHNTQDILKNKICYYYSKECRLKMHKANFDEGNNA